MSNDVMEVIRTDLLQHPAVRAWTQLRPQHVEPTEIEVLRGRKKKRRKSSVYRLVGVGPDGSAVVAKGRRRGQLIVEHLLYEQVLPRLPLPTLRCYGFVEQDDEFCWLFIEDAGTDPYLPLLDEHRTLAICWLASMHTAALDADLQARLPDRGPDHYLEWLRSARANIHGSVANPALTGDHVTLLRAIVSRLGDLESQWDRVQRLCGEFPRTLVHGDFVAKNLRVHTEPDRVMLVPFDWETAGWGIPAPDLAQLADESDLTAYWLAVRESWPHLDLGDVRRLARCGRLFRVLAGIYWASWSLAYSSVERVMRNMAVYEARLADAMHTGLG